MSGYGFFRAIRAMIVLPIVILAPFVACLAFTINEVSVEHSYQHRFGDDWQVQYEKDFGSLSRAHQKLAAAGTGIVAIPALFTWLIMVLRKEYKPGGKRRRREKKLSTVERTMRARSKALLWNYLGLLGVAAAVLLALFRWHIFSDHANEIILAMFVFCAGYCAVICGCWWWLRAKSWSEAVIVIGLWPLVPLLIPFVRLIFLRVLLGTSPLLLLALMVLTPAMLLVVVSVLPDKSGVGRKRRSWSWKDIKERQGP
jgi:hypothetical protein